MKNTHCDEAISPYREPAWDLFSPMLSGGWVYILTNRHHTVLYTGVTSNLEARIEQHKQKLYPNSFTARYNVDKLVYFKFYHSIIEAIAEEKRIKGGSRKKKISMITSINPEWKELHDYDDGSA